MQPLKSLEIEKPRKKIHLLPSPATIKQLRHLELNTLSLSNNLDSICFPFFHYKPLFFLEYFEAPLNQVRPFLD